jgi:glycosyltransferase involved in cell wall biosynthesis
MPHVAQSSDSSARAAVKVILATSATPFVHGGASLLVDWLETALKERGHEVDTFRIPIDTNSTRLPAQLVGLRMWDFTGHGDRLIAIRTPSYLIKHHSKVVWFIHHHRPAYDMWATHPDVADNGAGREFRRMMFSSDETALLESHALFANSQRVADRLQNYNGLEAEVLYPPLGGDEQPSPGPTGDSLVYVSRVTSHKRQMLAVEALAQTKSPVRLVIGGSDGGSGESQRVRSAIDRLGLRDRVEFYDEVVSDAQKNALISSSLGVVYVPEDEDSYGFVGLEAAAAMKPLVTTTDSGGVLELVDHGVNGLVAEPRPGDLAKAFDTLWADRDRAAAMGSANREKTRDLNISWDHVVERLLA